MMNNLEQLCNEIRADLDERNCARDAAIAQSRQLIRYCSEAIRAIHRVTGPAPTTSWRKCMPAPKS